MQTSSIQSRDQASGLDWRTLALLALINLFVGGMVGLERTVLPLLGSEVFGLPAGAALTSFVLSFGVSKSLVNLYAGVLADRWGRRWVLWIGWLFALPVPYLLINAESWNQIIFANALLGVNQALTWSMTLNMMIDLVPAKRRGITAGINEFMGYGGVSLLAMLTGWVAALTQLRPEPFYLGYGVVALGSLLSLTVAETKPKEPSPPFRWISGLGLAHSLGLATNLKDGLVWLALPLLLAARGLSAAQIGLVAGLYPLVWAVGQLYFGVLSDRIGRKPLIVLGMMLQGLGLIALALWSSYPGAVSAALLLGLGTGMVYPTLIAYVADHVSPSERATGLGFYRFFRDGGYVAGALIAAIGLSSGLILIPGFAMLALAGWAGWAIKSTSS